MKASELRIGNIIKSIGIEYVVCKIDRHGNIKGVEGGTSFNLDGTAQPIALTEEWLLKFGFRYQKIYNNYAVETGNYFNSVKQDGEEWIYSNDESNACCYELRSIKYVHQLQNIYFALNDREL